MATLEHVAGSVPVFQLSTPCSPRPFRLTFTISKITHTLHTHCLIHIFIHILLTYPIHLTTFPLSNFSYPLSSNSSHHTHILFPSCKHPTIHLIHPHLISIISHMHGSLSLGHLHPITFPVFVLPSPIPLTLCLHPSTPSILHAHFLTFIFPIPSSPYHFLTLSHSPRFKRMRGWNTEDVTEFPRMPTPSDPAIQISNLS